MMNVIGPFLAYLTRVRLQFHYTHPLITPLAPFGIDLEEWRMVAAALHTFVGATDLGLVRRDRGRDKDVWNRGYDRQSCRRCRQ